MSPDVRASPEAATSSRLVAALQRFRHGFLQLVLSFQALHRDPLAWKRYLKVCSIQALVTLAIASLSISTARTSSEGMREERVRKAVEQVSTAAPQAAPTVVHASAAPKAPKPAAVGAAQRRKAAEAKPPTSASAAEDATDEDEDEEAVPDTQAMKTEKAQAHFESGLRKLQKSILKLSKQAGPTAVRRDRDFQDSRAELDDQLSDLEHAASKLQLSEEDKAALVRAGGELDVLEQKTKPGFWDSAWALVLSIYGALSVAQAVVVALSRDFHVAIARDASLLLGVAPEDPPIAPRVRLNVAWVRRKFRQRTRSLLVFLPGVALLYLVALPFPDRALITSILTSLWATYWWVVWTASKSARAWERTEVARPPWFLRLWHAHVSSLPLVGWLARSWEGLWGRLTRSTYSPAEAVEGQPAEFAGLAAARALQLIPVVKLFVRPLVPVAAARLLAERTLRAERLLTTPQQRASLAAQRAAMPASAGAIEARDEM